MGTPSIYYEYKEFIFFVQILSYIYLVLQWAVSSAGRALQWHCRGQRFDPATVHHFKHYPAQKVSGSADFSFDPKSASRLGSYIGGGRSRYGPPLQALSCAKGQRFCRPRSAPQVGITPNANSAGCKIPLSFCRNASEFHSVINASLHPCSDRSPYCHIMTACIIPEYTLSWMPHAASKKSLSFTSIIAYHTSS